MTRGAKGDCLEKYLQPMMSGQKAQKVHIVLRNKALFNNDALFALDSVAFSRLAGQ